MEQIVLDEKTVLRFPQHVFFCKHNKSHLAISVNTANWLILDSLQCDFLKMLIKGVSLGDVVQEYSDDASLESFNSLLAQICARDFARPVAPPALDTPSIYDNLYIYLTYACNLNCSHCYMSEAKASNHISNEQIKSFLSSFKESGGVGVTFSGGEPLMRKDWLDLVMYAHQKGLTTTILSNGTLWSQADIASVVGVVDEVQISVDGVDEESNAIIRGKGTFQRAVQTATQLTLSGVSTSIATTYTQENMHWFKNKYIEFAKTLLDKTDNRINFRISSKLLNGRDVDDLSESQKQEYFDLSIQLAEQIYNNHEIESFALSHKANFGYINCGYGGLTLGADGKLFPCNRVSDIQAIGDISNDSISDIFTNAQKAYISTSVDNTEPCKDCPLKYICGGGCRLDDFECLDCSKCSSYRNFKCTDKHKKYLMDMMQKTTQYQYEF